MKHGGCLHEAAQRTELIDEEILAATQFGCRGKNDNFLGRRKISGGKRGVEVFHVLNFVMINLIFQTSGHEGQPGGAENYLKLSSPKAASRYAMMSIRTSRYSWTLKVHDEQSYMQLI
jgi:hypothetical protein